MDKFSITLVLLLAVSTVAPAQLLHYDVVKGSKKLGDMSVERHMYGDQVEYNIESQVIFRILFSFTIDYESSSLYKGGELVRESTISKLNGSTQKSSALLRNEEGYSLTLNDVTSFQEGPIDYSVASIYFVEPEPNQQVFSPQFGKYLLFEKIGEHQYKMESPDGTNIYTYMNGICTEVKVSRDFAKFYFRMTPETLYALKNNTDSLIIGND